MYYIDRTCINKFKDPIFVITTIKIKDGGSKEFTGLGYHILKWNIKTDTGLNTGYEIYKFYNTKNIEDEPSIDLSLIPYEE